MVEEIYITPNIKAEQGVLGCILLRPDSIALVAERLKPEHFYRDAHRTIYQAMLHLYELRKDCDQERVCDLLRRWDRLKDIEGQSEADGEFYIGMLIAVPESSYKLETYAELVTSIAIRRELRDAGGNIAAYALHEESVEQALFKAEEAIHAIVRREAPADVVPISQVETDFYKWFDSIPGGGAIVGTPTGFVDLDQLTGGLQKSDLIVLAARPGLGKTSLSLGIAGNAALEYGRGVLIFSLEMSRDQLFQRLVADRARINLKRLRTKQLTEDEENRAIGQAALIGQAPIYIDHTPALSLAAMRSRILRALARYDIDLIIVDYLQKMTATIDGKRITNGYQEVSEIAKGLKDTAREFNLPVLACAQLSRAVESRQNHIPQLSDLRESGLIEQESDIVAFIYRDEVYQGKESDRPKTADIIVAKHRNGPTSEVGDIRLGFEQTETRFYNLGQLDQALVPVVEGEIIYE